MKKTIKNLYYNLMSLKYVYECQKGIPKSKLLNLKNIKGLLKGFSSDKNNIYELEKYSLKNYLSDFGRNKTSKINGRYSIILDDKVIFKTLLKDYNVCPMTYGEIKNGKLYLEKKAVDIDMFLKLINEKKKVILKPLIGGGGKGIVKLEIKDGNIYFNKSVVSIEELFLKVKKLERYIISEYLENGEYLKKIFNETCNTIRIITMIAPETNLPFIAIAIQKVGSSSTFPVDNVWNGGYTSKIDMETGRLGRVAYHTNKNRIITWDVKHKDSGKEIEGLVIENWDEVKKLILTLAKELSFIKYIGWDVLVSKNGIKVIEGNNYSDVNFLQIHEPLLKNKRVRDFYKYHEIIWFTRILKETFEVKNMNQTYRDVNKLSVVKYISPSKIWKVTTEL